MALWILSEAMIGLAWIHIRFCDLQSFAEHSPRYRASIAYSFYD